MSRRSVPPEEPGLFDLPLTPEQALGSPKPASTPLSSADQVSIDLVEPSSLFSPECEKDLSGNLQPNRSAAIPDQSPRVQASLRGRLVAGLFDLSLVTLVGVFCVLSIRLLGVQTSGSSWPPIGLFLLSFSFLYHVVPLAFWGRTPGMATAGSIARNANNLPLSIGQAGLRWVGTVLTLALIGLPMMLAFRGASLTDRISGSRTFASPRSS